MNHEKNFSIDKVLIIAVVVGLFALAAADNLINSNTKTSTCEIVANNIAQNSIGMNH